MFFCVKQKIKILFCIFVIIISSFIIYRQMYNNNISITKVSENNNEISKVKVKSEAKHNSDVKLYQKQENEEFKQIPYNKEENLLFKKENTFEIDTKDIAKPNNISNINCTVVDNYAILDFKEASDNGTNYEYYLEKEENGDIIKTDSSKIYSESGIKGYSYIIDNTKNTEAGFNVNKFDNDPILCSNIDFNKDYYLHIRAIDKNDNYSENLTYKIKLPSKGIKMEYLDINTNSKISLEETIIGNVNDEYNVKDYNKILDGYKLIKIDGIESGKLKRERINIKYLYAKDAKVIVRYFNNLTGEEISRPTYIEGYEGKEFKIDPKNISKYKFAKGKLEGKMTSGVQEVNLYYDEIASVKVSYINEITKEKILPDEIINGIVGSNYETNKKDILGYDFSKLNGNSEGVFSKGTTEIIYYYKRKSNLLVKHVDIDTKQILKEELIEGYEGDKIKVNSEVFEGYVLNDEYKKKKNIIDEILEEEEFEEIEIVEYEKIDNVFQQYDIVISTNNTDYIIYYKKI